MTFVDASEGLPTLGKLELLDVRQVWKHEAHTFTPWLLANADALGELLGMDLMLSSAEHPASRRRHLDRRWLRWLRMRSAR
ncbi:hypothetical protein [Micromonospora sp. NBC_01740]|uniref:hypothetical protein n=1 Tax=Micromonospora sp. NBC_01740 TaxID=2975986 RepID=UPI003FA34CDB